MEGGTSATPHDNRRLAEFALRAAEYFFNGLDVHWPYSLAAASPSLADKMAVLQPRTSGARPST